MNCSDRFDCVRNYLFILGGALGLLLWTFLTFSNL